MTQAEFDQIVKLRRTITDLKDSQIPLRDFLAAAALTGLASRNIEIHEGSIGFQAEAAYKYADAMLIARNKGSKK